MTDELKKEAEDKSIVYADKQEYTISKFSDEEGFCWSQVADAYEQGALDFAEPREKVIAEKDIKIEELEQENTELKEKLGDKVIQKQKDRADLVWKLKTANEKKEEQLTKATDFLKGVIEVFVTAPTQFSERQKKDLFEDIEHFLSEVEE